MSGILGHEVGTGAEMKMGMGMGARRGCVGGDGRQPVPASEFSGASESKTGGFRVEILGSGLIHTYK
jgi:hypothetical protein